MKKPIISQEILLLANSAYSCNLFSEKNREMDSLPLSAADHLERACWNGLLYDILPGVVDPSQKLFLWQIKNERDHLKIQLGACVPGIKNRFSLDPHYFLGYMGQN